MLYLNQEIWGQYRAAIQNHDNEYKVKNPFLKRLLCTINDKNSTGMDLGYAIKDVLACVEVAENTYGDLIIDDVRLTDKICEQVGISRHPSSGGLKLKEQILEENKPIYEKAQRRIIKKLPLDPMLAQAFKNSQITHYNGDGQRQAIRTILSSSEDSLIFVQLPTGCGKTLAIHALSLVTPPNQLILVIVPTVGLGIEQGQRAKEILRQANMDHGGSYVWHSNINDTERQNIRQRMSSGTQRILFCSPEVAITSLRSQLFELSQKGLLGSIFVDEAHLIDSWGTEFRPEFQLIAALIRSLKFYQKNIRLILMSATFSQSTWDILKKIFKSSAPFLTINGGFLRPEIQFQIKKTNNETEHQKRVLECLHHLPRPIILYTVQIEDAEYWYSKLRSIGFARVGLFHGDTSIVQRDDLINNWKNNQLDIMIATSAFGVGMDKSDVHSVLHAAVPENIDRFYQEAGRGGRDGYACRSLLIYYEKQLDVAKSLSQNKLISIEKGYERWVQMHKSAIYAKNNQFSVSLSSLVPNLNIKSGHNRAWNIRTLLLMERSGLIHLYYEPKTIPNTDITDREKELINESYKDRIYIEILKDDHLQFSRWQTDVEKQRNFEQKSQYQQFNELKNWLNNPVQPLCRFIQQYYKLDGYLPEYSCGGCPGCRKAKHNIYTPTLGLNTHQGHLKSPFLPEVNYIYYHELHVMSSRSKELYIHEWKVWIIQLLKQKKIGVIRASRETLNLLARIQNVPFWSGLEFDDDAIGVSELVLVLPGEKLPMNFGTQEIPLQIILAPEKLPDPDPSKSYREWWVSNPNSQSLNDFLYRGK